MPLAYIGSSPIKEIALHDQQMNTLLGKNLNEKLLLAMNGTFDRLLKADKRIIFVIDNPEIPTNNIISCLGNIRPISRFLYPDKLKNCGVSRSDYEAKQAEFRSLLEILKNEYPKVILLDTKEIFCDDMFCSAKGKNGESLYLDSNHLSLNGSKLIGLQLVKFIN
jgi:hypothetical protein